MQDLGSIQNVCVIGAGTMGSGIAAHLANLGFKVTLMDLTQEAVVDAFDKARSARPPHFYVAETANEVRLANLADDLDLVSEADWVCEAIVERPEAKKALYEALERVLRPDAMISTNTSGLQIEMLSAERSESFKSRFLGTHFFNPPRYLKLLELIPTPSTDPSVTEFMRRFLEERGGKRVVLAKDTPGFIANRYGMWAMFHAVHVAEKLHLTVEEVDEITGAFLGRPKSASFRLCDLVGLDVMRDIAANLVARCPDDPHTKTLELPASVHSLIARNWIGEKVGQGYYRREGRELLALDLQTYAYRNRREVTFPSIARLQALPLGQRLREALDLRDEVGEFLRHYLVPTLAYAAKLQDEVSHSVQDFDRVMEWGFGWERGPFALIDAIGPDKLGLTTPSYYQPGGMLTSSGTYVPVLNEPEFRTLQQHPILEEGDTYRIRDLGEGIVAVGLTTKMGVVSPKAVDDLTQLIRAGSMKRFVLTSEARSFSAGFDLKFLLACVETQDWAAIDESLQHLQELGELLEQRQVVAAVYGHCLGAGLELALSCSRIAAAADVQVGLPEARVGLIPGGRGTTLMRLHNQSSPKQLTDVAMTLTHGNTGLSADEGRQLGYLRPDDVTVYHPDRLISTAKNLALDATDTARPAWSTRPMPLMGMIDRAMEQEFEAGTLSEYDVTLGQKVKHVFVKAVSYEDALLKERVEFVDLCAKTMSLARLRHMLETGKPLRN